MDYIEYYINGHSLPETSDKYDIPMSTLRRKLLSKGVLRSRIEGIRLAAKKGRMSHLKGKKRVFTKEWKDNMRKAALKRYENSLGYYMHKGSGYYRVSKGVHKGKKLHRVIMEQEIGRKLKSNEVVHHINEIKTDNRIENLQLMTHSEHSSLHAMIRLERGQNFDIGEYTRNKFNN